MIAGLDAKETAKAVGRGKGITIEAGEKTWELAAEDIVVVRNFAENMVVSDGSAPALAIDTEITPELLREGIGRDVVRHIQQIRKDSGLEIQDHIEVCFESDSDDIKAAIAEHGDYICQETLCGGIAESDTGDEGREVKIVGCVVKFAVVKAG